MPPKRTVTTNLSTLNTVKRSSTNDQITSIVNRQENTTNENLPSDRPVLERFELTLLHITAVDNKVIGEINVVFKRKNVNHFENEFSFPSAPLTKSIRIRMCKHKNYLINKKNTGRTVWYCV